MTKRCSMFVFMHAAGVVVPVGFEIDLSTKSFAANITSES